jgi:hypothetical protein
LRLKASRVTGWLGLVTQLGLLGPVLLHEPGWAQPKTEKKFLLEKIILKKSVIF